MSLPAHVRLELKMVAANKKNIKQYEGEVRYNISKADTRKFKVATPLADVLAQEGTFTVIVDGKTKEMSCRVAMLRMERDGIVKLPPPRTRNSPQVKITETRRTDPPAVVPDIENISDVSIEAVTTRTRSSLWNEYTQRYHYLGYTRLSGNQMRYFVTYREYDIGLLGFGAAAWKTYPRDHYIGWSHETRQQNLHLVVNNARFLILPWINRQNLASRILSLVSKRIAQDWDSRYKYRPVLLETFVQEGKFNGTCYKAANWLNVGLTKGRGKLDVCNKHDLPIKSVWLYPLRPDFRRQLTGAA